MAIEFGPKDRYRAYGVPSLDLPFADRKSLVDRISGNNLVTFTRSTTATYVGSDGLIKTAAVNEPRFDHNPLTRESLGLLVEEARENLIRYSQKFDELSSFGWVRGDNNLSTPVGGSLSPDNTNTAFLFTEHTSSSAFQSIAGNSNNRPSVNANQSVTASIFLKPGTARYLFLSCGFNADGMGVVVDMQTKTIASTRQSGTCTIVSGSPSLVSFPNDWYKLSFSGSFTDTSPRLLVIGITNSSTLSSYGGSSYTGTGLTGYFWGAQLETGSFPTSYIPTTGSTVTRAADVASMNANPYLYGTFFAKYKHQPGNTNYRQIFSIGGSTAYSAFVCRTTTGSPGYVNIVLPGILDLTSTANTESSQFNSVATTRVVGNYALSLNGGTVVTSNSSADNTNNAVITFMYGTIGAVSGGHIARFTYYPVRLGDDFLRALTV